MRETKNLTPFKLCVLENFPFIEADFDAVTNYQLLCKIVDYLNKVIENENNLNSNFTELNNNFNTLKNYVDTFFENLDVQEEINHKIDELVADGTITNLIKGYIDLLIKNKLSSKWIVISDSYGLGVVDGGGTTTSFIDYAIEKLPHISIRKFGESGGGFVNPGDTGRTFLNQLEGVPDDSTVTDILVAGGYNDNTSDIDSISYAIYTFINYVKQHFVNARVHIAVIGNDAENSTVRNAINNIVIPAYSRTDADYHYITNASSIMKDITLLRSVHPTPEGQIELGKFFTRYIGANDESYISNLISDIKFTTNGGTEQTLPILARIVNDKLVILTNTNAYIDINENIEIAGNGLFFKKIGTIGKNILKNGSVNASQLIKVEGQFVVGGQGVAFSGNLLIADNGDVKLSATQGGFTVDTIVNRIYLAIRQNEIPLIY